VQRLLLLGAGALAAACLGVAAWGVAIEPRIVQKRSVDAPLPDLPRAWDGQRLALMGDIQLGAPLANTDAVQRAVRMVLDARPSAVLLTGDYVYDAEGDPAPILGQLVELLAPLGSSGVPVLAVLGNHDFARDSVLDTAVEATLERIGMRILRNEAAPLSSPRGGDSTPDNTLYVVGLGERTAHQDNWRTAFRSVPPEAARVVLAHNPLALRDVPAGWAPLAVAGHTHGGQIRAPWNHGWAPARRWMPWPQYVDGWIDGFLQPGNRLLVNRGIGFSKIPVRIGAPPEVTLITLRREG
jgi:predicted MPP superfamily phosphohydrolase